MTLSAVSQPVPGGGACPSVTQDEVTEFYRELAFPSGTSHSAYEALVPARLEGRVADFGCGQSLFVEAFRRQRCDALFLDVAPSVLSGIDYGSRLAASLTDIPLGSEVFDRVFCIGVVHHIPEMERAIHEILRVLKPAGELTLGVYAPRSVQARLRSAYDRSNSAWVRHLVRWTSGGLIWLKNGGNGLRIGSTDHRKRISDLLDTPLARYLPLADYEALISRAGASIVTVQRISQMNVLTIRKRPSGQPSV